ncbi:hypothetical protein RvY_11784 [Ramazzottius varieornatus]|uniref:Uncharacterized protein n=1 Tax=Ramazzottius varieornatus TaxID=947166 RepID=A0A1D1VJN2_RAMVA|nr:hypothetical protein RvY_11784 [Ramazzottius varieornatus]
MDHKQWVLSEEAFHITSLHTVEEYPGIRTSDLYAVRGNFRHPTLGNLGSRAKDAADKRSLPLRAEVEMEFQPKRSTPLEGSL